MARDEPISSKARQLVALVRYSPRTAAASLLCIAAYVAVGLSFPLVFQGLFDDALPSRDARALAGGLGLMVAIVWLQMLLWWARAQVLSAWVTHTTRGLRADMMEQIFGLSPFEQKIESRHMSLFTQHIAVLEQALLVDGPRALSSVLMASVGVVLLFVLEWRLALLTLLALPIAGLGQVLLMPGLKRASHSRKGEEQALHDCVHEIGSGQREIHAFGLFGHWRERFLEGLNALAHSERRSRRLLLYSQGSTVLGGFALQVIVIACGVCLVFYGAMSVGAIIGFLTLLLYISDGIYDYSESTPALLNASDSLQRIHELLDQEIHQVPTKTEPFAPLQQAIQFRGVCFGYDPEHPVSRDISLQIRRGESVALVGSSGSGKSTLLRLLLGFHQPQKGAITWDGRQLDRRSMGSLRARVGVVFQQAMLFELSVADNIRMGDLDASQEQIVAAAKAAEIHDAILALPQGYDTRVGPDRLSGGQQQRIAIARALVREPELLLLDEAMSALDPKTEAGLKQTLAQIAKERTVLSVTHRLSTVREYDKIVVLDKGQIVESGSHGELLRLGGLYWELVQHQSGFVVSPDGRWAEVDAERLKRIPVLRSLSDASLKALSRRFVVEHFAPGQEIICQGEVGERFYLIVRGQTSVVMRDASGAEVEVGRQSDGDFFGEIALLEDVVRTATVRASSPVLALTLDKHALDALLAQEPQIRSLLEAETARRKLSHPSSRLPTIELDQLRV